MLLQDQSKDCGLFNAHYTAIGLLSYPGAGDDEGTDSDKNSGSGEDSAPDEDSGADVGGGRF